MKKPSLRVSKWMGDIPVEAECTACAGVRFNVRPISHRPNREEYQKSLQSAFTAHMKNVHSQEDANEGSRDRQGSHGTSLGPPFAPQRLLSRKLSTTRREKCRPGS